MNPYGIPSWRFTYRSNAARTTCDNDSSRDLATVSARRHRSSGIRTARGVSGMSANQRNHRVKTHPTTTVNGKPEAPSRPAVAVGDDTFNGRTVLQRCLRPPADEQLPQARLAFGPTCDVPDGVELLDGVHCALRGLVCRYSVARLVYTGKPQPEQTPLF